MTRNQHLRKDKEFKNLVEKDGYLLQSEYINNKTKVKLLHLECGKTFLVSPSKYKSRGVRCPCQRKRVEWNTETFSKKMEEHMGKDFKLLSEYTGIYDKSKVLHETCGNTFEISTRLLITRGKCPYCKSSKGETIVRGILERADIKYIEQFKEHDCKHIKTLSFDFYLPEHNTIIEYQGQQHYEHAESFQTLKVFEEGQIRDDIKRRYCKENCIKLIEVPYWEKMLKNLLKIGLTYSLNTIER